MDDCLFCKIIKGEIPSHKVYEDANVLAFLDITPVNPGHVLLVPKKHSRNILEIDDNNFRELAPLIKKIARAVKEGMGADGINIHINNEPAAGQVIFHTHIHIIPRFSDDGLKMWRGQEIDQEKLMGAAKKITNQVK